MYAPSTAGSGRWQPTPNANATHPSHPFPALTAYSERGGCVPTTARVDGYEGERSSSAADRGWKSEQTGVISASVSHRATSRPVAALGRLGRHSRERRVRFTGQRRSETPSAHDVITRDTVQGGARARTGSECVCDVSAPDEGRGSFPEKRSSRGDCYHRCAVPRSTCGNTQTSEFRSSHSFTTTDGALTFKVFCVYSIPTQLKATLRVTPQPNSV